MRILARALFICVLLTASGALAQDPALKGLYEQHRWGDLRQQIDRGRPAPPLYLGAVASARNDTASAEKYLRQAIEKAPGSAEVAQAHEQLGYMYARAGR